MGYGSQISKHLYETFEDPEGGLSAKRVITAVFGLAMLAAFIANTFFGTVVDHELFSSLSNIVMVGLGSVVAEKYSGRRNPDAYTGQRGNFE